MTHFVTHLSVSQTIISQVLAVLDLCSYGPQSGLEDTNAKKLRYIYIVDMVRKRRVKHSLTLALTENAARV